MQLSLLHHITYDRTSVFCTACVKDLEKSSSNKERKLKIKGIRRNVY